MAAAKEYVDEQLNYYRICHVTTDILTEGLRTIFKQEWDGRYRTTLGEWKDDPSNGRDFYNAESRRNRKRNKHMLSTMIKGNRAEWDSTMLFYAILNSDCISSLNAVVEMNVDDLRKVRNETFAHMPRGQLSELEFKNAIGKVFAAFQAVGLSTVKIQEIANQKTFPTEELRDVLDKMKYLKKDLDEKEKKNDDLEDQLKKIESQCQYLDDQLKETEKQRQILTNELQETEEKSRNLKDQLKITEERQRNLKDKLKETEERRKSLEDQLKKSEFQRKVLSEQLLKDTSPFCILPPKPSHDMASRDVEVSDITKQLQELKQADVNNLSIFYISGNPGSGKSQLAGLVAKRFYKKAQEDFCSEVFVMTLNAETPDTLLDSYITFARQMKCPEDAITQIHISKDLKTEDKINSLISLISSKIGQYESWLLLADNVKSLSEMHVHLPQQGHGQWGRGYLLITTLLTDINPCYKKSMTTATTLAVKEVMQSDRIIDHALSFLSLTSSQPLNVDVVVNYILNVDEGMKDEEMIIMKLQRCSLLLSHEDEFGFHIRVH